MKFSIKDFFSKCDQICSFLRIWSRLLNKSLMENFIFCTVLGITESSSLTPAKWLEEKGKEISNKLLAKNNLSRSGVVHGMA